MKKTVYLIFSIALLFGCDQIQPSTNTTPNTPKLPTRIMYLEQLHTEFPRGRIFQQEANNTTEWYVEDTNGSLFRLITGDSTTTIISISKLLEQR